MSTPSPSSHADAAPPGPLRAAAPRLAWIDAWRGFAIAQMVVFHFIYDLKYFRWIDVAMTRDPPWVLWRAAIVTQFVLLVGAGLVLRESFHPGARAFWRRWLQIAGAAALVSAGSAAVFGPRFIWFGILHFVAVALLLARPLVRFGVGNAVPGAVALVAGLLYKNSFFDSNTLSWIGFATTRPRTEDYVPILPWIGVVLLGVALASIWRRHGYPLPAPLKAADAKVLRPLIVMGRWPLTIYLLHQPIMMGVLWCVARLMRSG